MILFYYEDACLSQRTPWILNIIWYTWYKLSNECHKNEMLIVILGFQFDYFSDW